MLCRNRNLRQAESKMNKEEWLVYVARDHYERQGLVDDIELCLMGGHICE